MRRTTAGRGRAALLVLLALVAAACTGGDDTTPTQTPVDEGSTVAAAPASEEPSAEATASPTATTDDFTDPMALPEATGAATMSLSDDELIAIADDWIAEESGLDSVYQEQIHFHGLQRSGRVAHVTYVQGHDDVDVRGATFIVHVLDDGTVQNASNSLRDAIPAGDVERTLDESDAVDIAGRAVPGTVHGEPSVTQTWIQTAEELRLGWQVMFSTREPYGAWAVVVDATTSQVLSVDPLGANHSQVEVAQGGGAACNLPGDGPGACVFLVDPLYAVGAGSPDEISDDQANAGLVGVRLQNLDDPDVVQGAYAELGPELVDTVTIGGALGEGGRGTDDFEAGMAYFWVDYAQRQLQRLGITDLHSEEPIDLYPVVNDLPDNAFFDFIADGMFLGFSSVTDRFFAEDASAIIHEYGHAIVNDGVGLIFSAEGGAFHEGFADVFALLTTLELRNGDTACLTQWVTDECLRRIDEDAVYPGDLVFEPHLDGQIYSGAIWDLLELRLQLDGLTVEDCVADREANPCGPARDELLLTLAASLGYLTPELGLHDAAAAFFAADQAQLGGANEAIIAAAFAQHGLATDGTGTTSNTGGELPDSMTTPGSVGAIAIDIRHSYRGDLDVDLVVVDAAGTVLCEASVFDPDSSDGEDDLTGVLDLEGSGCEGLLPPSPDRIWALTVVDTLAADMGEVLDFTVFDGSTPYPAQGLPLPIPDADPAGVVITVDGSTGAPPPDDEVLGGDDEGVKPPDMETMPPAPDGSVTVELAVTHTYVGDLQIRVGVATPDGAVQCSITLLQPDPGNAADNVSGTADVSACGALYPPAPDRLWFLEVVDTAAADVGTIDRFALTGPGGTSFAFTGAQPIPDDDPGGALVLIDGT